MNTKQNNNQTTMQLILGRVHWGWCIFYLHNQSLTHFLADHRFPSDYNIRWWLLNFIIIILWLYSKSFPFPIPLGRLARHSMLPRDRMTTQLGRLYLIGLSFACLIACLCTFIGLFNLFYSEPTLHVMA